MSIDYLNFEEPIAAASIAQVHFASINILGNKKNVAIDKRSPAPHKTLEKINLSNISKWTLNATHNKTEESIVMLAAINSNELI